MENDSQEIRQPYAAYRVIDPHNSKILTYIKVL